MKSKRKWIAGTVSTVLMLVILAVALLLFASKIGNKPVFLFGYTTVWVMTDSMEDTIPAESYILVKRTTAAQVNEGDVIMFQSDDPALHGAFNTHRVKAVVGDHAAFQTQGDNNPAPDRVPVAADRVVGVYCRNMPFLTLIGRLFRSVFGLIILFVLGAVAVVVAFAGSKGKKQTQTAPPADFDARVQAEVERLRAAENQEQTGQNETPQNKK